EHPGDGRGSGSGASRHLGDRGLTVESPPMSSRVLAVVIAILSATPALPQCNFTPILSAQFRSSAFDLAIDGNDLWVATGYGITLYDRRTDPPQFVTSIAVPGVTRVVRVSNG